MKRIIAMIIALIATITLAAPASASTVTGRSDQDYVEYVTTSFMADASWSDYNTLCDWFLYDRRDFYRTSYRDVWSEDVSYYDMRVGLYRALKPIC